MTRRSDFGPKGREEPVVQEDIDVDRVDAATEIGPPRIASTCSQVRRYSP
jgi:hypothetical protein